MAISINCTNKGCGKYNEVVLDAKTNQVFCSACDKEILDVSHFVKTQLKALKQIRRAKKQAFAIKCNDCKSEGMPKLVDDKFVCAMCSKPVIVSKPFEPLLRKAIKEAQASDNDTSK